jgi:hypothetical protein
MPVDRERELEPALISAQRLRQLRHVDRDPARFIGGSI